MVLEARSLKPECWQDWFLLEALRDNLFLASLLASGWLLAILGVPLAYRQIIPISLAFPSSVCHLPFSSFITTPVISFRAHLNTA